MQGSRGQDGGAGEGSIKSSCISSSGRDQNYAFTLLPTSHLDPSAVLVGPTAIVPQFPSLHTCISSFIHDSGGLKLTTA